MKCLRGLDRQAHRREVDRIRKNCGVGMRPVLKLDSMVGLEEAQGSACLMIKEEGSSTLDVD